MGRKALADVMVIVTAISMVIEAVLTGKIQIFFVLFRELRVVRA